MKKENEKELGLKILAKEMEIDILKEIKEKGWSLDYDNESINEIFSNYIENYYSKRFVDYQDSNNLELGYDITFVDNNVKVNVWKW